ncbi:MAG: VOC family protein [Chloroflexi bacterium]|nr:VOC family protein [Chloroflexota bacterium]MBV9599600.1 VOC family protein [Chloroflexota bacterium]
MSVCALDHIVLDVADVQRSLDFYQRALGLAAERVDAWRRGEVGFPSLRVSDGTIIDLVSDSAGQSPTRGNLAHFCLVTDSPNLDQAMQTLSAAGVAVETGPVRRSGARGDALSIYFRDPDENLIELRTYG